MFYQKFSCARHTNSKLTMLRDFAEECISKSFPLRMRIVDLKVTNERSKNKRNKGKRAKNCLRKMNLPPSNFRGPSAK